MRSGKKAANCRAPMRSGKKAANCRAPMRSGRYIHPIAERALQPHKCGAGAATTRLRSGRYERKHAHTRATAAQGVAVPHEYR
jgi:hypothetical protein